MFRKQPYYMNTSVKAKKKTRCISLTIITLMTLLSATVMELCNRRLWAEAFPAFAPHYSDDKAILPEDTTVEALDNLILAKSVISGYLIVITLILQLSYYIVLPVVTLAGSPVFFVIFLLYRNSEKEAAHQREIENRKVNYNEESAKKQLKELEQSQSNV